MKTEQHEVVPQTEQQRIEGAIDTAPLNADLLREQVAELEQALLAETQAKHEAVECIRFLVSYVDDLLEGETDTLLDHARAIISKHPEAV